MYIHDEKKLAYLAHPKTASISTATALKEVGFRRFQGHHSKINCRNSPINEDNRHEWTTFTTVRNHYDLVISWTAYYVGIASTGDQRYEKLAKIGWTLDEPFSLRAFELALEEASAYVTDRLFGHHIDDADYLLHFETLQEDLDLLLKARGLKSPQIRQLNVTPQRKGRHYSYFYTDETREYIGKRFAKEIAELGYSFKLDA
jgi:hypothetical protein